jgi:hypothetical protein
MSRISTLERKPSRLSNTAHPGPETQMAPSANPIRSPHGAQLGRLRLCFRLSPHRGWLFRQVEKRGSQDLDRTIFLSDEQEINKQKLSRFWMFATEKYDCL